MQNFCGNDSINFSFEVILDAAASKYRNWFFEVSYSFTLTRIENVFNVVFFLVVLVSPNDFVHSYST